MSECKNCKYYSQCGDDTREKRCEGYAFQKPAYYKTSDQITAKMSRNRDRIKELEAKIDELSMIYERRQHAEAGEFDQVKALRDQVKANEDQIADASAKIEALQLENYILKDNLAHAIFAEAWPIIKQAFAPYEGKPYGEKTAQKVRDAVRDQGYGFYFETCTAIKLYKLGRNGFHVGSADDICIYSVNDSEPFITSENRVNMEKAEARPAYIGDYCENIRPRINAIKKAFNVYKADAERAYKSQSALNAILPSCMSSKHAIETGANYLRLM